MLPGGYGKPLSLGSRYGKNHLAAKSGRLTLRGRDASKAKKPKATRLCVVCRRIADAVDGRRMQQAQS